MIRLFAHANYKFIEIRRIAYIFTAIAIALSIGFGIFWHVTKGSYLNYGVDFTGGTLLQVRFKQPTSDRELRNVVQPAVPGTEITHFGSANEFLLRAPATTEAGTSTADHLVGVMRTRFGNNFDVVRTETVGPKVGGELQNKAALAILFSFAATLAYLAFRFEWRFGLAAVIATAHDTLITLGLLSIFRFEIGLPTVAAVLTILGYSLHDTIIIFDRIRENLKKYGRKADLIEIMDRSINETLPRTILTVSTVVATLLALALLGGTAVSGFAWVMLIGVVLGTYSSIFVASPVLWEIEKRWGAKPGARPARQTKVAV
ncbi:MAG TPA: protein translocase subunit SecF [Longimicrobiales bacterium]